MERVGGGTVDTPDSLRRALEVVDRRINRALDRRDQRWFVIGCQHRTQLLHRLAAMEDDAVEQVAA
jgi:hypothetical protein